MAILNIEAGSPYAPFLYEAAAGTFASVPPSEIVRSGFAALKEWRDGSGTDGDIVASVKGDYVKIVTETSRREIEVMLDVWPCCQASIRWVGIWFGERGSYRAAADVLYEMQRHCAGIPGAYVWLCADGLEAGAPMDISSAIALLNKQWAEEEDADNNDPQPLPSPEEMAASFEPSIAAVIEAEQAAQLAAIDADLAETDNDGIIDLELWEAPEVDLNDTGASES